MSSEYRESPPDPNVNGYKPSSELWETWEITDEDTQPRPAVSMSAHGPINRPSTGPSQPQNDVVDPQVPYREHVTNPLPVSPPGGPQVQPVYPPYSPPSQGYPPVQPGYAPQGHAYPSPMPAYPALAGQGNVPQGASPRQVPAYPGYPGYPPGYYPYPGYPYPASAWSPPKPKRDTYLFAVAIASVVGSSIALLTGLVCAVLLVFVLALPHNVLGGGARQLFASIVELIDFASAGILGGTFGLYHSIRSLLKKPSSNFSLPTFWIFLALYLAVVGIGFLLHRSRQEVTFPALTILLIVLAAAFPAFALLALGIRRLRLGPTEGEKAKSPTTWRRLAVALISGGTSGIFFAFILELILTVVLSLGANIVNINQYLSDPSAPAPQDPALITLIFLLVVVIAPLVEEIVKPLGVVVLIGRISSAAEAFLLGLACGIGFDLVETAGYISMGYRSWLNVALERTGTGLLHGFGAAMVALGWYYITRPAKDRRVLLAIGCWLYAVVQHAIWNGSAALELLPAPIGPQISSWNLNLGFATLPFAVLLNIIEALIFLTFFIYVTGKLRTQER